MNGTANEPERGSGNVPNYSQGISSKVERSNGNLPPKILVRQASETKLSHSSSRISLCSNIATTMETLDDMILEMERICLMYMNNQFADAIAELEKRREVNFCFVTLKALFLTQGAVVTGGDEMMKIAQSAINDGLSVVNKHRKKKSKLLRVIWTENYEKYDELEIFAEMAYLYLSAMNMVVILGLEKTIVGLIKTGYYAKSCIDTMNECQSIVKKRKSWFSEKTKETFKHATFFSVGIYNLLISMLPPRILKLLQFIGFDGNRKKALKYIEAVAMGNSIWADFGAITLLSVHLQLEIIAGLGNYDEELCARILTTFKAKLNDSGFFLIFEGIFEQIQGNPAKAIELLHRSRIKFTQWIEWENACYWLIMWCHAIQCDWVNAVKCACILKESCNWSKCVFTYQIACFKTMMLDELPANSTDTEVMQKRTQLKSEIDHLLKEAPKLKKTIAGKTMFIEKFVTKRCEIYLNEQSKNNNQEMTLMLPVIEQLLFWNTLAMSKNSPQYLQVYVDMIDKKLDNDFSLDAIQGSTFNNNEYELEKYYNLILMKGVIYHYMNRFNESKELLKLILENENHLKMYKHLAPLACLELGLMLRQSVNPDDVNEAEKYLTRATCNYSHFLNETMVHIRAYNALADIKDKRRAKLDLDTGKPRRRSSSIASLLSNITFRSRRSSSDSNRRGSSGSRCSSRDGRRNSTGSHDDDVFVDCPEA